MAKNVIINLCCYNYLVTKRDLFIKKIQTVYPEHWEVILTELEKPRLRSFRKVLLVGDGDLNFSYKEGPFSNSYILEDSSNISSLPPFDNHEIYVQGLASMIPAIVAKCKPGELVLDLCAAPGSKSSQIANDTNDGVALTCVENNTARLYALKENLVQQNIHNYQLLRADAAQIQYNSQFWEKFDKVIADVPCSNEGNIRFNDTRLVENWNPKLAKKISQLQKKIISSGIKSLKKGGRLVYSTCTYSVEENEEVVDWALKHFKDVRLESIDLPITNILPGKTTFEKKNFDESLSKTTRILPNHLFDGFFVASLLKF